MSALETLMSLYSSGELAEILESALVNAALLSEYGATEIRLSVDIDREDYELCRLDLLRFTDKTTELYLTGENSEMCEEEISSGAVLLPDHRARGFSYKSKTA